ncbi:MAG: pathogenicity locus [Actinomycetia bacterium]|nr:pathogenicity locus [Actinomycetes bacterium]
MDLQQIPGVGPKIAAKLGELRISSVEDLKGRQAEDLYFELCALSGTHIDRCVLYVFRCAIYFASHTRHDPELLKWWRWSDRAAENRKT